MRKAKKAALTPLPNSDSRRMTLEDLADMNELLTVKQERKKSMEKRKYKYGPIELEAEVSRSPEDIRRIWSTIYADLKNAKIVEHEDGSVEFVETPGTKG